VKRASISEAKNQLSALLDRVRRGQSIVIEDRGVPVARLEGLGAGSAPEGRLARLERDGVIRRAVSPLPPAFFKTPPPRPAQGRSASAMLIEERHEGR
jgi:prevent-host-death family protein